MKNILLLLLFITYLPQWDIECSQEFSYKILLEDYFCWSYTADLYPEPLTFTF